MPLKIYTDESVPVAVVAGLQRRGVTAVSARDENNLGLSDLEQLEYAVSHQMVIFTHDTDFLQLAHAYAAQGKVHYGIVYVHQEKISLGECIRRLKEITDLFERSDLQNHVEFL
jgi:predicted nuclease of predicted toxin-antitoxin system